jgi:acid stress-induced BolA-like protein IbaG/YrbA
MGTIEQKVRAILKMRFSDEEIRFDHEPGERISGFIVSDKFFDMDHEARQRLISNLLYTHLAREERRQVLGFLAFTPEEERAYAEAREDSD